MSEPVKDFDSVAGSYDDWYRHPQGLQVFKAEAALLSSLLPHRGLGLEVGAGTGVFAERLRGECCEIVCLDPSPGMLSKARDRGLLAVIGLGDNLPFRSGAFSFAYMATVAEFLSDPVGVFREVRASSKTGSPLVILFINSGSLWGKFYTEIGLKGDPVFRHAVLLSLYEVERLLLEAGYMAEAARGTLTTGPMEPKVGAEIASPSDSCGVIAVKAKPVS